MRIAIAALLLIIPGSLAAQTGSAYRDPVARELVARARATRGELGRSITSYTAVLRQRSAFMLRMPLRDRLLDREETAARVRWSRDGEDVVQMLGGRSQESDGISIEFDRDYSNEIFDPAGDRVYFALAGIGADDDEMWVAHPLADDSESFYEYASGDTITLRLSGRTIRAVQLNVFPRVPSFHYFTAVLWIEPESGAVVQAAYRPARPLDIERDSTIIDEEDAEDAERGFRFIPGFLKPLEADFESIIVQYSLWDLRHWLPRLTRIEGYFRAGSVRVPFSEEMSYEIESVTDDSDGPLPMLTAEQVVAGWAGTVPMNELEVRRDSADRSPATRIFAPRDSSLLLSSEALPPPIWDDAPEFASEGELESLVDALKVAVPRAGIAAPLDVRLEWGWGAGLLRYNRVEGLSVGARAIAEHPLGVARATARVGTGELNPSLELNVQQPRWGRTLGVTLHHQIVAVNPKAFGLGSSLSALLFGRDGGEYYRASGVRLDLTPAAAERQAYRWTVFAERQQAVERGTVWSVARLLGSDRDFRPNLVADEANLVGASLALSPWWGREPRRVQGGVEYFAEGAAGDREYARSSLTVRSILPIGDRHRIGIEAGGGTSWGDLPAQAQWFLGGSETLRGYDASSVVGASFLRGRLEIARGQGGLKLALFGDGGWAGDREAFDTADLLLSAGVGATVFDGLLRFDVARALREPKGWRVELYLDAVL